MDDLTPKQMQQLNHDLLNLQKQLISQLQQTADQSQPVTLDQQSVGRVSRIDAIQQQQMAKANRSQSEMQLNRVVLALKSVEQGGYGYCKQCDESIGFARLKARPDSPLCVHCQSANE